MCVARQPGAAKVTTAVNMYCMYNEAKCIVYCLCQSSLRSGRRFWRSSWTSSRASTRPEVVTPGGAPVAPFGDSFHHLLPHRAPCSARLHPYLPLPLPPVKFHRLLSALTYRHPAACNPRPPADLHKIGGLAPLLGLLRCRHPSLRWRAAEVIATCCANNPPVQVWGKRGRGCGL